MKTPALLLAVLLAAGSIAALSAGPGHGRGQGHAHGHAEGGEAEWAALFGDAPLPVVWRSVTASREKIEAALAAQTLEGVDAWAETIHLAAHALVDQVKLGDEGGQRRLEAALNQAAKLADDVLDAAQHDNRRGAVTALGRLKSALNLAQTRLPAEVVEAAATAEPRFAEAPAHE